MNATIEQKLAQTKRRPSPAVARALRLEAGLTQAIVAEAIGVSRITMTRFELGHQALRPETAERLAQLLAELAAETSGQ